MQYLQITYKIGTNESFVADLWMQCLADLGCESFEQTDTQLSAYIEKDKYTEAVIADALAQFPYEGISYEGVTECEQKDWNAQWEQSFQPIYLKTEQGSVLIHSPFHKDLPQADYSIIISPKMAFGTGHHATTCLMLSEIMQTEMVGKQVLDMGCGTAILGLLARRRGAETVVCVDIDDWCTENAKENIALNELDSVEVRLGDKSVLNTNQLNTNNDIERFDVVLANINRNILLTDMPTYTSVLKTGGSLLISGFYEQDIPLLTNKAQTLGLSLVRQNSNKEWAMLHFKKQ